MGDGKRCCPRAALLLLVGVIGLAAVAQSNPHYPSMPDDHKGECHYGQYRGSADYPHHYYQRTPGHGYLLIRCSGGLVFKIKSVEECGCDYPAEGQPKGGRPKYKDDDDSRDVDDDPKTFPPRKYTTPKTYPTPHRYTTPKTYPTPHRYITPKTYPTPHRYTTPKPYPTPHRYTTPKTYPTPHRYTTPKTYPTPHRYTTPKTYPTPHRYTTPKTYPTGYRYTTPKTYPTPHRYTTPKTYPTGYRYTTPKTYPTPHRYTKPSYGRSGRKYYYGK